MNYDVLYVEIYAFVPGVKMADNFRQDLPPVGGYPGINFTRAIPKQRFSAMTVIVGSLSIMTFGWVVAIRSNRERRQVVVMNYGVCL